MSGSMSERVAAVTASAQLATPDVLDCYSQPNETDLHLSGDQISHHLTSATIGHMDHLDTRHHLEQLTGYMGRASIARRRHSDFARVGLGVRDELGDRLGRK
jgi:hypothetical protein